jgi:hypothetical protein
LWYLVGALRELSDEFIALTDNLTVDDQIRASIRDYTPTPVEGEVRIPMYSVREIYDWDSMPILDTSVKDKFPRIRELITRYMTIESNYSRLPTTSMTTVLQRAESKNPHSVEIRRLQSLWNVWSDVVLNYPNRPAGINILMLRRLFLIARTTGQNITARQLSKRYLNRSFKAIAPFVGWRTLGWLWIAEAAFAALVSLVVGYLITLSWILIQWLLGDPSSAAAVLSMTLDPFLDLYASAEEFYSSAWVGAPRSFYFWYSALSVCYITTVGLSVSHHLSELLPIANAMISQESVPIAVLGFCTGVFYKFGILPIVHLISLPVLALVKPAAAVVILQTDPWCVLYGSVLSSLWYVVCSDYHLLMGNTVFHYSEVETLFSDPDATPIASTSRLPEVSDEGNPLADTSVLDEDSVFTSVPLVETEAKAWDQHGALEPYFVTPRTSPTSETPGPLTADEFSEWVNVEYQGKLTIWERLNIWCCERHPVFFSVLIVSGVSLGLRMMILGANPIVLNYT